MAKNTFKLSTTWLEKILKQDHILLQLIRTGNCDSRYSNLSHKLQNKLIFALKNRYSATAIKFKFCVYIREGCGQLPCYL